jgi:uncharacterized membrane protein
MTNRSTQTEGFPPRRFYDVFLDALAAIALFFHIGLVAYSWSSLPERIPHHFNAAGVPDRWGGRWILILLPAIALVLYAGLTVVAAVPRIWNWPIVITPENAARQYRIGRSLLGWLKVEIVWLFLVITWSMISVARGAAAGFDGWFVLVFVGAIFLTIAVHLVMVFRWR